MSAPVKSDVTAFLASNEDAPAFWDVDILWLVLATGEQTGGAFSLMEELCPQGAGPPPHWHEQDEIFYVIDGRIAFRAGEEEFQADAGRLVFIPRGTVHAFRVDSETARILNAYTPAGYERTIPAFGTPARERALPPRDLPRPDVGAQDVMRLFAEVGMHLSDAPDLLHGPRPR